MRSEAQIRAAELHAVATKESTTNDRTHSYAEGVQDALAWVTEDEDGIDGIDLETRDLAVE